MSLYRGEKMSERVKDVDHSAFIMNGCNIQSEEGGK